MSATVKKYVANKFILKILLAFTKKYALYAKLKKMKNNIIASIIWFIFIVEKDFISKTL